MSTPDFISESFTVVVNGPPQTTTARTLQDWVDAQSVQPAAGHGGQWRLCRDLRAQRLLCVGDLIRPSTHPGG